MRLILIRHAPTAETGRVLTGRLPGVALSEAGIEAAAARAEQLHDTEVDHLYTSPVQRCTETAKILGVGWGLSPVTAKGLTEADFGSWSGRPLRSLYRLKAWQRLMDAPERFRFPGGESFPGILARVVTATEELAARHRGERVVAVSHSDVIRVIVGHYLGAPLDVLHRLEIRPVSASIVDLPDGGGPARVPVVNSLDDLKGY
jgi:probable phosphoglycerate mutase